ncbi:MAG TPA: chemotaxis protein CheW, partial [Deltaproteobacteria bacterium]|nr:chemotaxis protein CheW [Deltaproteobacteria bacterium]
IYIEITDDGKGIDKQKVLERAIEKGLAEPGKSYSDKEIFDMLFAPGLSTAEKVSEISGRGVGMDVVKKNIEDLHGSVDIISETGKGSTFRVKLPLTLAIIDGMMVRVGGEVLTIPLSVIDKSVRPSNAEVKTVEGKGELVDIRGDYIPLVRLYDLFKIPSEKTDPTDALVVVLQGTASRFGVLVDDVLGQTQAVIKSIDKNFRKIEGTSGATILGNGRVSLILDVHGMEHMAFEA